MDIVTSVQLMVAGVQGFDEYRRANLSTGEGPIDDVPYEAFSIFAGYAMRLVDESRMDDLAVLFGVAEEICREGDAFTSEALGASFFEEVIADMRPCFREGRVTRSDILAMLGECSRREWLEWEVLFDVAEKYPPEPPLAK
jgi:hypothetical protein